MPDSRPDVFKEEPALGKMLPDPAAQGQHLIQLAGILLKVPHALDSDCPHAGVPTCLTAKVPIAIERHEPSH